MQYLPSKKCGGELYIKITKNRNATGAKKSSTVALRMNSGFMKQFCERCCDRQLKLGRKYPN